MTMLRVLHIKSYISSPYPFISLNFFLSFFKDIKGRNNFEVDLQNYHCYVPINLGFLGIHFPFPQSLHAH